MTYKQSILIHAYVIPLVIVAVLAALVLFTVTRFLGDQKLRKSDYEACTALNAQASAAEARMAAKRNLLAAWRESLSKESIASLNDILQEQLKTLSSKQLEWTSTGQATGAGGLSVVGAQPSSRHQLEFRGGYAPMQTTLLALESRLPQLQLESLDMSPDSNGEGLRYVLTYTAWEQPAK